MHQTLRHAFLPLLLALTACASTRRAPSELVLVTESVRVGTVLSGPLLERTPEELDWGSAWKLVAEVAYREHLPTGGEPLTGRVVVVDGTSRVFGVEAQLAARVRVAPGGGPTGEGEWSRRFDLALPAGATASLWAELGDELSETANTDWDRLALEISRSADDPDRVEVALVLEGSIIPPDAYDDSSTEEEDLRRAPLPVEASERIVLDAAPVPGGPGLRFLLPAPTRKAPRGGITVAANLVARAEAGEDFAACVERARRQAGEAHARATLAADRLDEGEGFRFESGSALTALSRRDLQRPALVFLAHSTQAAVTEELALVAGAETLGEYLTEVGKSTAELERAPESAQSFGWFLERSAFRWLCARSEDETRELEPELFAILVRHAGELARYPDLLREAVVACGSPESLAEALIRENRIFLEDAHPAARVRAYDWLAGSGGAPEGFDPLAPPDERRAALARFESEAAAARAAALENGDRNE